MDKGRYGQLELFAQAKDHRRSKAHIPKAFIGYISKYEKAVLIIIGFLITAISSFSLGVKKGRSYITLKTDSQLDIAVKSKRIIPPLSAPQQITREGEYQPIKKEELKEYIQNYTIQVASFLNKVNAQREAENLRRKGLSPQVLSKGKFSIVCVGNFAKREEAESLLPRLRKQYQDCRIRRL